MGNEKTKEGDFVRGLIAGIVMMALWAAAITIIVSIRVMIR